MKRLFTLFLLFAVLLLPGWAQDVQLEIRKTCNVSEVTVGGLFAYRLQYRCTSTTSNGTAVTITDALDSNLELMALTGSVHTVSESYDADTHTVTFTFTDPLPAGASGDLVIQVRFKAGTSLGTVASNQATMQGTNANTSVSEVVNVTATGSAAPPGVTFTDGVSVSKFASFAELNLPNEEVYYYIRHGNTGETGQDVDNYIFEDMVPEGTSISRIYSGYWGGTGQTADVFFKTNLNSASWQPWGTNPRISSTGSGTYIYPSELALAAGEHVTGVRIEYGTLPGGGLFHPDAQNSYTYVYIEPTDPTILVDGSVVTNCADVSADGHSDSSCVSRNVVGPSFGVVPEVSIYKTGPASLQLPYTYGYYYFDHGTTAPAGMEVTNYSLIDEVPAGFEITRLYTGYFRNTNQPISVFYKTNIVDSWTAWPGTPSVTTGSGSYLYNTALPLAAGEYMTGVRMDYGTLPGGGYFHPDSGAGRASIRVLPVPSLLSGGEILQNCATAESQNT